LRYSNYVDINLHFCLCLLGRGLGRGWSAWAPCS